MPCDIPGHVHEWPQAGNLQIYDCETICGICGKGPYTGGLRFLRKHVTQMHTQKDMPELVVLTEVDLVNARRRVSEPVTRMSGIADAPGPSKMESSAIPIDPHLLETTNTPINKTGPKIRKMTPASAPQPRTKMLKTIPMLPPPGRKPKEDPIRDAAVRMGRPSASPGYTTDASVYSAIIVNPQPANNALFGEKSVFRTDGTGSSTGKMLPLPTPLSSVDGESMRMSVNMETSEPVRESIETESQARVRKRKGDKVPLSPQKPRIRLHYKNKPTGYTQSAPASSHKTPIVANSSEPSRFTRTPKFKRTVVLTPMSLPAASMRRRIMTPPPIADDDLMTPRYKPLLINKKHPVTGNQPRKPAPDSPTAGLASGTKVEEPSVTIGNKLYTASYIRHLEAMNKELIEEAAKQKTAALTMLKMNAIGRQTEAARKLAEKMENKNKPKVGVGERELRMLQK